jgi:nucleoside 2-deoxyribosyltransferase
MRIYFAAPLFSDAERRYNEYVCGLLEDAGHSVLLPQRDGFESVDALYEREGIETTEDVMAAIFDIDRAEVLEADLVVAVLDGLATDEGVAVEMATAYDHDIPVIGLHTDLRVFADHEPHNSMVFGLVERIVNTPEDLVAALKGRAE